MIFFLLPDSVASKLEPRMAKFSEIVNKVASDKTLENRLSDNDDGDEEDEEDDDNEKEGENTEEAILDIHSSVQCLLDLVPLMEQILERSTWEVKNLPAAGFPPMNVINT